MAISHETEWFLGLQHAIKQAKKLKKKVLFSEVKKIGAITPLSFYQAGRERYAGERFFWQDPAKELVITGLGKVEKLQTEARSSRVKDIEERWSELQVNAVKTGVTDVAGTGPLMFGGFSFDYNKSDSLLWDQFQDNLFYIPAFMVSIVKGQAYLTTNLMCAPEDQESLFLDMINEREQYLNDGLYQSVNNANQILEQREIKPDEWKQTVAKAVQEMKTSDLDKVVLARELRITFKDKIYSEAVLEKLQEEQPGSYIFGLESASDCFIGATPERLIKKQGNELYSTCLAGSIARGKSEEEDERLGQELLHDQKNLMEHQYVVSMITKAMKYVCHNLMIPEEPAIMKNRHIQHLYTPVKGECMMSVSILDIVDKLHPTPAMGGLPKERAIEWISKMEDLQRGFYAGPLGWADTYGNGEFVVGIRSALLQGKEASLFAGCGVLEDSTPESEYKETAIKFNPMLSALGGNLHE